MASELDALLAQQLKDANFILKEPQSQSTAALPQFQHGANGGEANRKSRIAYTAYKVLRDLATLDDELLWHHFGDIISKWPGCTSSQNVQEAMAHERAWVASFRQNATADGDGKILAIRKAIASIRLEFLSPTSFAAVASSPDEQDALAHCTAMYHKSEHKILIPPFFPRVEELVRAKEIPEDCWDAVVVSVAKTMVHEVRRMVGTLLHGPAYCTPQADFAPSTHAEALHPNVEHADWYELSRYGAFLRPALISPFASGGRRTATLKLTGHISTHGDPLTPHLRCLLPGPASRLAKCVLPTGDGGGSFLALTSPFFAEGTTLGVKGFVVSLEELMNPAPAASGASPSSTPGPHDAEMHKLQPVPTGKFDIRKIGYTNLRGVLRG
ncbi:hypothetical protein MSAN_00176600 [Mycena sanguinolenta]|uniref:Uncharacterized protein n=1 Tax=Mycena sanguinolenta TaxID=230812 RepID=A0A8H6ZEK0_9AGAR|nr:hypothetical protein MSAN_00176600 [Mycena sanguinolenta]